MERDEINAANEETKVGIDLLLNSLRQKLTSLSFPSSQPCIYRVPERLSEENPKAYTPKVISIGPLHNGRQKLLAMEEIKQRYMYHLIDRFELNLENLVECVKAREQDLRDSYAETIKLPSHKFLEIVLVDASFIIEFLLRCNALVGKTEYEPIFCRPYSLNDVTHDMFLLLENQLPTFILVDLLDKIPQYKDEAYSTLISIVNPLLGCYLSEKLVQASKNKLMSARAEHFLHMIFICYKPSETLVPPREKTTRTISASGLHELHQAGVKIKAKPKEYMTDLHFEYGVLEIPQFELWYSTEPFLRNLIAFEQCHFLGSLLGDYAVLMHWLVRTPQDAELLIDNKVTNIGSGNPYEVSNAFKNLGTGVCMDENFFYAKLCDDMNAYCDKRRHRWQASLMQNYFSSPWAVFSVIAAIVLLILTFLQTLFSGMSM